MSKIPRSNDSQIVVWHVGGESEDYGPAMPVLTGLAPNVLLVVFEARANSSDTEHATKLSAGGIPTKVIYKGIHKTSGSAPFYVNKFPLSSSFLPPSPLAVDENPRFGDCHRWGECTELDYVMQVDTVTLDEVLASGEVPPPDIISMDAQGAELGILEGATKALAHALCVVTEVEFFEIYNDQPLFDDQMRLLSHGGFRLLNILSTQYWYPGPAAGYGFLTVGEAIFIRYAAKFKSMEGKRGYVPIDTLSDAELLRLIGITMSFHMLGYTYTLAKVLQERNLSVFATLPDLSGNYKDVPQLVATIEKEWESYQTNPLYFRHLRFNWRPSSKNFA